MNGSFDCASADLFVESRVPAELPGSAAHRASVSRTLAGMLAKAGHDRHEIAARASRLTGKDVSKYMLDAYTAESREEFNIPLWLVPAVEAACSSTALTDWLCAERGGRLFMGADVLAAELGRIERQRDALQMQVRAIKRRLQDAA